MWDVYAAMGRYLSTDFVVCDSKGSTMHATAQNSIAHNFMKLKEGGIYSVKIFAVQPNKDDLRVLKNATFMLELDGSTTIRKVFVKPGGFIRFPFEMVDFEHLETTNNKYLIDAAGYATNVEQTVHKKTGSKTLGFHLTNSRVNQYGLPCGGRLYMSNTSSTLILDDEDIPEIKQLKSDTSGVKFSKELLPVGCSDAKDETLENLLKWSRNRRHDAAMFHCTVRIDNVRTRMVGIFHLAEAKNAGKVLPVQTAALYRLELEVLDDTTEVVVVMFNETASSLVKCTADSIVKYEEQIVTAEGMDESGGSSMAGGSHASETPEFKRLLRHPSVTTPSKVNEAKKQKRGEVVESDDETSFIADTQAASGMGGSLPDTRKHKSGLGGSESPPCGCLGLPLVDSLVPVMALETKHSSFTSAMSSIRFKNFTCLAIGERHLPIESIIASRSTDVMVKPQ
nr:hypothetical protein [Tanacetum cinerariifolium]